MLEIFNVYIAVFFYLAIGFPLIGGALLYMGFQLAKVPDFTFVRCWKIYLAGLCYGYLVVWGVGMILQAPTETNETSEMSVAAVLRTILFYVVPMIAIPILCRDYSRRAIITELIVILVANSIMIVFAYTTLPHFINTKPVINPSPENSRVSPPESTGPGDRVHKR
jgi:hypothetical protein